MTTDVELLKELITNVLSILALMVAIMFGCFALVFLAKTEEPYRPQADLGSVKYYNTNTTTASPSSRQQHTTTFPSSNCHYFDKNAKKEEPKEKAPVVRPYMIPKHTWAICPKERVRREVWDLFAWGSSEMTAELHYLDFHDLRDEENIWTLSEGEINRRFGIAKCILRHYAHLVDDPLVLAHYQDRFHRFGKVKDTKPRAKFYKDNALDELMEKYPSIPSMDEVSPVNVSPNDDHNINQGSSQQQEASEINAPVVGSNTDGNLGVDTTGSPTSNNDPATGGEQPSSSEGAGTDFEDDEDDRNFERLLQSMFDEPLVLVGFNDESNDAEDDDEKSVPASSPPSFEGPFTVDESDDES